MSETKGLMASVVMDNGLWYITGGATGNSFRPNSDFIEIYTPGEGFSISPTRLPVQCAYHSLVALNSTHLFFVWYAETHILDTVSGIWTQVDPPRAQGDRGVAALIEKASGEKEVVYVGGYLRDDATEIFSLETLSWRDSTPFPSEIRYTTAVPQGKTFLVVGGYISNTASDLDTIYRFDPDSESWELLPQRLEETRSDFPAFYVPEDFVPC